MRQPILSTARYQTQMPTEAIRHWRQAAVSLVLPDRSRPQPCPQRQEKFPVASVNRKVDGLVRRIDSYAGSFG
ncbi:conserved hypothetical protein [Burkholderia gladioli]|nr:conserved hypothetical protein [Burkholderia gladioli]